MDEYEVNSDITKRLIVQHDFDDFDLMKIEFTKTKEPFNRIVVDYFSFGDITGFTMEKAGYDLFSKINQTGDLSRQSECHAIPTRKELRKKLLLVKRRRQ